ncbi:carbohydrate-binding module family 50 protein [Dissoconium aciculare CBS 342.82]|uniref:Carbohydrate-binding module family 50 protein n=1 Tax=Dissoconium aciculare CBS 342.82 TaxID=1314786 RepID=A0A6J3LWD7_9PEZI|nr:carbohydrate-binding module family 50 protein [Dissoconium aciculare CBS 342.82]KAF1819584.1 carbohydrate-binding module family 50 protein [Dissoconium aciculare CBS 342.82]
MNANDPNPVSLRPRARRLISGLDGDDHDDATALTSGSGIPTRRPSPLPSTFDTRPASPIPAAHPQRSPGRTISGSGHAVGASLGRGSSGKQRRGAAGEDQTFAGLWGNSWTTLQGIASDLLGSDLVAQRVSDRPRSRKHLSVIERQRSSSGTPQWGQSGPVGSIGVGTREEQTAAFRTQKKRDMLTRQESSYADTLGKYKRRLSDDLDGVSSSVPPAGHHEHEDRDALVYLHDVRKEDTLAGIALRYNIHANALRKANRMWPNDTVQTRQHLILPVDACGVKGRPVRGPDSRKDELEVDLLGSADSEDLSALLAEEVPPPKPSPSQPVDLLSDRSRNRANSTSTQRTMGSTSAMASNDASTAPPPPPPWTHDSWVLLPNHQIPTEIVRLPRRAIAYFPPARRKSISYSDNLTTTPPSSSLDLSRGARGSAASAAAAPALPNGNNNRGYVLSGPGGVGTLAGKNVKRPGPAQDGLNAFVAKHLPNLAITSDPLGSSSSPSTKTTTASHLLPPFSDEPPPHLLLPAGRSASAHFGPSSGHNGAGAGNNAFAFGGSGGATTTSNNSSSNLEAVGGAIESWVRRLASKAAHQFPPSSSSASQTHPHPSSSLGPRASVGAEGKGVGGVGDLIEMTDDLELGGPPGAGSRDGTSPFGEGETGRGSALDGRGTAERTFRGRKSGKAD